MTGTAGQTQTAPPPGPRDGAGPRRLLQPSLRHALPHALPAAPTSASLLFSGSQGEAAAPQSLCVLQGSRKLQGQTRASSASCGIVRGKWGPRWGSHFPRGGHTAETQAGGIGESGGHGWPTTSRKAAAGQTSDAEGPGPLPQASPSSLQQARLAQEPRDSVVCLAVGSGATPLGKEGSLRGPEAIKQEVGQ